MPTVSNRYEVQAALVSALAAHANLAGVDVSHGWPGKHLGREHVWIVTTAGTVSYPLEMAGRKTRQDEYMITVFFFASNPGNNQAEAAQRVQTMYQALDDLAADGEVVGSVDGVLWSLHGEEVIGPDVDQTDEGAEAYYTATVSITARYS